MVSSYTRYQMLLSVIETWLRLLRRSFATQISWKDETEAGDETERIGPTG